MSRYVDLDERVTAQFYDQECEEWTMQTVTIEDVLDSVCDEYTILLSIQPEERTEERTETHASDLLPPADTDLSAYSDKLWRAAYERGKKEAEEERKRGKWTKDNGCPFCGFQPWYERDIHTLSFCPNCGADMRGGDEG